MKRKTVTIILLLSLIFSLAIPAAAATDLVEDVPLFMLVLLSEEEETYMDFTAFYAEDRNGNCCLVTSVMAAAFQEAGYDDTVGILSNGFAAEATLLGTAGDYAFYDADGLEAFQPVKLASDIDLENVTFAFVESDDLTQFNIDADAVDLTAWTWNGTYYILSGEKVVPNYLGSVFVDNTTGEIVGMGTCDQDLIMAMVPAAGSIFPTEMVISSTQTTKTDQKTNSEAENGPEKEHETVQKNADYNWLWLVGICVAAVAYYLIKNKRPQKSGDQVSPVCSDSLTEDKTQYIPEEEPQLRQPETSTQAYDGWQLRCTEGILRGQVFSLGSDTTIGRGIRMQNNTLSFPENTQGISARHCKLSLQGDHVVLRDLGSTYGTILNGSRIEAHVEYHLHTGDVLTLPGQQCFRLEKAGAVIQDLTPAVQSVAGVTYRADLHGRLTFGRNIHAQVSFDPADTTISTNHCTLYRQGGKLYLMDTSSNGTFFRANRRLQPNTPYPVKKGDTFFLASVKYSFIISED